MERPRSWKICPKGTAAAKKCEPGFYWNELACECFYAEAQCEKGCPWFTESADFEKFTDEVKEMDDIDDMDYMRIDPAAFCGDCMSQKTEHFKYYPTWADPYDVKRAESEGL